MTQREKATRMADLPAETNEISGAIVDAVCAVHSELGPGLLESIYEKCLVIELRSRNLGVKRRVDVPVVYRGRPVGSGISIGLLVEQSIVVELKAVDAVLPIHKARVLTVLKLTDFRLGLLINFNVAKIKSGIHRIIL